MNIDELLAQRAVELEDDRRKVLVSGRRMRDISADSVRLLEQENETSMRFFQFGDVLAEVVEDEERGILTRHFTHVLLKGTLDRLANFVAIDKDGNEKPTRPPTDVVADLLALPTVSLPPLKGVLETPVYSPTGELAIQRGYDRRTGYYIHLTPRLAIPDVDREPNGAAISRARQLISDELIGDFPFATEADTANAIGVHITPYASPLIAGPKPLIVVESPTPGSGKDLLVDVLTSPMVPSGLARMTEAQSEDEWRKRITAKLLAAPQFILIDNVRSALDSAALSAALTSRLWEDRVLGQSRTASIPVNCIWFVTANNPRLSVEIARRSVSIRLDSKVQRPWQRMNFKYPDLRLWARQNRGDLIWAGLTLVRAWIAKGMPAGKAIMGSYEEWAKVVGGVLDVAGVPGFLGNSERLYASAEEEMAAWGEFVAAWWTEFRDDPVGSDLLFEMATRLKLLVDVWGGRKAHGARTGFGIALSKMRDRVIGKYCIKHAGEDSHTKSPRYRLELLRGVRGLAGASTSQAWSPNGEDVPSDSEMGREKAPQPPALVAQTRLAKRLSRTTIGTRPIIR